MQGHIRKYPSTRHVEGSRHQCGDSKDDKLLSELEGHYLVQEEKLDGANTGVSFSTSGKLQLQSRGHYLAGGGRERHFSMFKTWANVHAPRLHQALTDRFIMYGEWVYAKHTCYYNALSAYFFEFDVLDTHRGTFLSTRARRALLGGLPIVPVPVLKKGIFRRCDNIADTLRPTQFRTATWREDLMQDAAATGSRPDMVMGQSDLSELAEGIYIKLEDDAHTIDRFKYVRGDFLQTIQDSQSHWHDRPILPNRLAQGGIDIFAEHTGVAGAYDDPNAAEPDPWPERKSKDET